MRADGAWRQLPILMLTGGVGERESTRALSAGADAYMIKPFRLAELEARIARLLPPGPVRIATAGAAPG